MCSFDYWSVVDLGWVVGGSSICRSWCMVSWSSGGVCRYRSSVGCCRGVGISRCWRMVGWGRRWCRVGVIGWGVVWGWSCSHSGNYAKKDLEQKFSPCFTKMTNLHALSDGSTSTVDASNSLLFIGNQTGHSSNGASLLRPRRQRRIPFLTIFQKVIRPHTPPFTESPPL